MKKGVIGLRYEIDIRERLIDNTIHLVAEGGFEKATTRAIANGSPDLLPEVRMNESYIYRLFGGKTQLYDTAFSRLDNRLFTSLHNCVGQIGDMTDDPKDKLYAVFLRVWRFLLGNEDACRCYIRYYYSVYFKDGSRTAHNDLFQSILTDFDPLFKEGADVTSIMHSVFTTLLDFAIRVYNGDLADTDTNREHIFNVLFGAMAIYMKPELLRASTIQ